MSASAFHKRFLKEQLADPEFREAYEQARREIDQIDQIMHRLEELRVEAGLSKAELARRIGRNSASVRRWLTAQGSPELRNVVAMLDALGAELKVVPRSEQLEKIAA